MSPPGQPLRIAYVINSVEGGGAALPVPELATLLRQAGAEVIVLALTRRDGRALAALAAAGLEVVVRDGEHRDHWAALRWLGRQVARWRPTHIWTSLTRATLLGQWVGRRAGLPVVSWQHAAWLRPANLRLLRLRWRGSALWVADSRAVAAFCQDRIGIPADRLAIWPIFRADPTAPPARPWQTGETLRIAAVGRLHPVKGFDLLVEAIAPLRSAGLDLSVTVAGDGAEHGALQAMATAAGLDGVVRFAGYVDEPRTWLAGHHLYVQPSRSEGFCVAAHEAMQAGLPVIGAAVGEMSHSIEDGVTGWRFPPGEVDALRSKLQGAAANPAVLAAMGEAARAKVLAAYGPDAFQAAGLAVVDRLRALKPKGGRSEATRRRAAALR